MHHIRSKGRRGERVLKAKGPERFIPAYQSNPASYWGKVPEYWESAVHQLAVTSRQSKCPMTRCPVQAKKRFVLTMTDIFKEFWDAQYQRMGWARVEKVGESPRKFRAGEKCANNAEHC